MVTPSSTLYTVYTVIFHKYGGASFDATNFISHVYMFIPTKANVKLSNVKTINYEVIGNILSHFFNCPIIYTVGSVYYFPGLLSNTISLDSIKCYSGFKKVTYKPLEYLEFVDSQGNSWVSTYHT